MTCGALYIAWHAALLITKAQRRRVRPRVAYVFRLHATCLVAGNAAVVQLGMGHCAVLQRHVVKLNAGITTVSLATVEGMLNE